MVLLEGGSHWPATMEFHPQTATVTAAAGRALDEPQQRAERSLRTLALFHYLLAVFTACLALTGIPWVMVGRVLMKSAGGELPEVFQEYERIMGRKPELHDPENRAILGGACEFIGAVLVTLSLVHGGALTFIGRCIARRRLRILCVVFSILDLTFVLPAPLGTALSIYALIVLRRPAVKERFARQADERRYLRS